MCVWNQSSALHPVKKEQAVGVPASMTLLFSHDHLLIFPHLCLPKGLSQVNTECTAIRAPEETF